MPRLKHDLRKDRLTGSTIAAYLGYNGWQSPREQWELNNGQVVFEGNKATRIGQYVEQGLARFTQEELKLGSMTKGETMVHPDYEMFAATPDFLFLKDKVGLQIKNHWPHMARGFLDLPGKRGHWDNDLVPMYHQMQCQLEREVVGACYRTDFKVWLLGCYFGGADFRIYRIRRDRKLMAAMLKAGMEFWYEHLDPRGPCLEPDNSTWRKARKEKPKIPKMSTEELAAAPISFLEP